MNLILTPSEIAELDATATAAEDRNFPGTPFSISVIDSPASKPGTWATKTVAVYRDGMLLGGYRRLYPSHADTTFAPFQWEGHWYALFSANYTCTRVLRMNEKSLEDWCGESAEPYGFCPAEYFMPQAFNMGTDEDPTITLEDRCGYADYAEFAKEAEEFGDGIIYPGFGFLSGCKWGDDTSRKLRYVDYTRVADKVLLVDERFGYFELPARPLVECVDLTAWESNFPLIFAHKRQVFCVRTAPGVEHPKTEATEK